MRFLSASLLALSLAACSGRDSSVARAAAAAELKPSAVAAASAGAAAGVAAAQQADSSATKADAGRILGSPTAKVWMIIISDFQCPYCKQWHDESWAAIKKDYVDTGKIRVAYMNLPLGMHRNAQPAAEWAMCASVQGKFWPVQDALFRSQDEWKSLSDASAKFEAAAVAAGADASALKQCVAGGALRPLIAADVDRATRAGASSTPTFFIGNKALLGAQPLAVFRDAIETSLAAAK